MISYLKGKIISKGENFIVIETHGIGFKTFLSPKDLEKISEGETRKMHCFLYLKRETIELYGFLDENQLEFFKKLEELSGIGPKTALLLAPFGSLEVLQGVLGERQAGLIKGIGMKKLQRIITKLDENSKKTGKKDFSKSI